MQKKQTQHEQETDGKETRGGLEPKEFQKRLIFVTATVLVLGIVGGTCLGMKIRKAEKIQEIQAQQGESGSTQMTPSERANRKR